MLNSSHQNTDNQQQLTAQLQWLEAALSALHSPNHDTQQRKAAEAALVAWQRTDPAWILCLHLLQHPYHPNSVNLLLFAAQTLRTKINEQGARLPAEHLTQLKNSLLQKLLDQALPTALLRQLCLAVASCVALLPSCSKDWLQAAGASLPMRNAVQLLHDVAEEGSSDWRHVIVPGRHTLAVLALGQQSVLNLGVDAYTGQVVSFCLAFVQLGQQPMVQTIGAQA